MRNTYITKYGDAIVVDADGVSVNGRRVPRPQPFKTIEEVTQWAQSNAHG